MAFNLIVEHNKKIKISMKKILFRLVPVPRPPRLKKAEVFLFQSNATDSLKSL